MTHPAYALAEVLKSILSPACLRIEIAGSLRRQKPDPHDIEIVCIPSIDTRYFTDMFNNIYDTVTQNKLENMLGHLYADGAWCLEERTRKNGSTYLTDGPNYKRLIHIPSGICCDLFIVTDPRKWGMIYTIRTGSGVFSKDLMTWALKHHWFVQHGLLHLHRAITNEFDEVQECPDGQTCPLIADTPEEEDVFEALGLPWIEPPHRTTLIDALAMTDWLKNPTRRLHGILDRALEKALEKDVA